MEILFATSNTNKIKEITSLLPDNFKLLTLYEAGITEEILETSDTISGNSELKARYCFEKTGGVCFAEDTGLEVLSLGGRPGVYSARYAGEKASYQDNVKKLLEEMADKENRIARFVTVITFIEQGGKAHFFEGVCEGIITKEPSGKKGFGYDSIFVPFGAEKTFAEMELEEKNNYSHRRKAFDSFLRFLNNK